ncbi:predicted protein [Uncinocarpus reesii 1704]|uniref:Uncharacterized protein n=1 Tax=Uncinocarpus reesii (strain UAMH 1704) TaxID=336963 RepID=C4JEI5_UNCRE|nr:uncharacterized protein UREG_00824 [Uncinocarpus reesii 1704]EEP75977.1 predicted protein [Uncinocarpus reesii 1704]
MQNPPELWFAFSLKNNIDIAVPVDCGQALCSSPSFLFGDAIKRHSPLDREMKGDALTCPGNDAHRHGSGSGSGSVLTASALASQFLYIPQHHGAPDRKLDITISPLLIARGLPSPLSFVSDSKSFYTAFEVTDINAESLTPTDSQPPSPLSSATTIDGEEDMEEQVEPAGASSPMLDTELPSTTPQTPSETEPKKSKKTRRKGAASSKGSQTPTTSRSSSVSGSKSTLRRNQTGPYRQLHLSRTTTSERQFPPHREERDLVALHRDSRRLFESFDNNTPTSKVEKSRDHPNDIGSGQMEPPQETCSTTNKRLARSNSAGSPSLVPLLHPTRSPSTPVRSEDLSRDTEERSHWGPLSRTQTADEIRPVDSVPAYKVIPPTVIDWTSPTTRRREYEKIDRSTRGIRGMWRRFAPKWCQSKDQRIPFFDETKEGKQKYEGSVRRFRMDIPDDDDEQPGAEQTSKAKGRLTTTRMLTADDDSDQYKGVRSRLCFGRRP